MSPIIAKLDINLKINQSSDASVQVLEGQNATGKFVFQKYPESWYDGQEITINLGDEGSINVGNETELNSLKSECSVMSQKIIELEKAIKDLQELNNSKDLTIQSQNNTISKLENYKTKFDQLNKAIDEDQKNITGL